MASRRLNTVEAALRRIAVDLSDAGGKWALIGGLAVSARAEPRTTRDVDVCVGVRDDADQKIGAGEERAGRISAELDAADLVLLLVSPDFIASDHCVDVEVMRALARHDKGEAMVVPVIVRYCAWEWAPFGKLQRSPRTAYR